MDNIQIETSKNFIPKRCCKEVNGDGDIFGVFILAYDGITFVQLQAVREELSAEDAGGGGGDAGEDSGEGRACALTALMLHCCAAAQLAQRADTADPPT